MWNGIAESFRPQWSPALIGRERRRIRELCDPCPVRAAMEPCPYRQGEPHGSPASHAAHSMPQWSPALIGRESRRRDRLRGVRCEPQWSPALIGRERCAGGPAAPRVDDICRNGALPLSAGRG